MATRSVSVGLGAGNCGRYGSRVESVQQQQQHLLRGGGSGGVSGRGIVRGERRRAMSAVVGVHASQEKRGSLIVRYASSSSSSSAMKLDVESIRSMSDDNLGSMLEEASKKLLTMRFSQATMQAGFNKGNYKETKKMVRE